MSLIVSWFKTPIGLLKVAHDERCLLASTFVSPTEVETLALPFQPVNTYPSFVQPQLIQSDLCQFIADELEAYFHNPTHPFRLPLIFDGTPFQHNVWRALLHLSSANTITYGELAAQLQSHPRAIGQACKKNPLVLFIPCHRVVRKDGLGGYMGNPQAITYKKHLLHHENTYKENSGS